MSVWPSPTSEAWRTLSKWLEPNNENTNFWWQATGPIVASMLMQAGYSSDAQYEGLLFHCHIIAPALGPRPNLEGKPACWKSFMTDDFSPIELSWSWGTGGPESKPKVRYSVEAISTKAGSIIDPYNQVATLNLVNRLQSIIPNSDWQWFKLLSDAFNPWCIRNSADHEVMPPGTKQSSMFLGFEFQEIGVSTKAYLVPTKATLTGQTPLQVITEGVRSLEKEAGITFPAYDNILNFLTHDREGSSLDVLGIALDCVDPRQARLKLYVRSSNTSFDSVRHIMRMHITPLSSSSPSQADDDAGTIMTDLFDLWKFVLTLPANFPSTTQLPSIDHPTSGILYNFELRTGNAVVEPKVYIPVKHYGTNDRAVAEGLVAWLRKKGRGEWCAAYLRMLEGLVYQYGDLRDGKGVQTFVQCGVKGGKTALTSYLSPEIYRHGRKKG